MVMGFTGKWSGIGVYSVGFLVSSIGDGEVGDEGEGEVCRDAALRWLVVFHQTMVVGRRSGGCAAGEEGTRYGLWWFQWCGFADVALIWWLEVLRNGGRSGGKEEESPYSHINGHSNCSMVYQARTRKRVFGIQIHRGPDGSAFQKCETCGISVAIALADMHECEPRKDVKKFKCQPRSTSLVKELRLIDQPRSAFRVFMEDFVKKNIHGNDFEVDKKGFETWKNMKLEEKFLYFMKAETINLAHKQHLLREENDMPWRADDEADSADVGKYDENYEDYDCYDSESSGDLIDFGLRQTRAFTPVRGRVCFRGGLE
ncbi:hypothetical protein HAX54_028039 [Datura stramonium]|uniref:HMG box domain-containing protein n=1 Tax=Datura stramonium TaxID=4076 RepID=A0ABS8S978_DATST|nr:hypothetical protein [Datura stramonium]